MTHMQRCAAIVVSVLFFVASPVAAQDICTFTANINISAPDLVQAKFVVSAADCCNLCWALPQCAAAIYSNYFCHLKGTTGSQMASLGTSLILPQRSSPPPPPTTEAPTTTAAPTTAAPLPPPVPTTPVPTPSGTVTIVREVQCQYSSTCNPMNDQSCTTAVYYDNVCQKDTKHSCGTYHLNVSKYAAVGCSGPATHITQEDLNVCKQEGGYSYYGHYCDVQPSPQSGLTLVRTSCPYGCNDGTECTVNTFTTGTCTSNPFQNLAGQSVMASCFAQYVVYSAYASLDCSGVPSQSRAEPVGQKCFLDSNEDSILNICDG